MTPITDFPWTRRKAPGDRACLAVGTMNFGKRTPFAEAERIVKIALERGVRWFDTANAYGDSETILARCLGKQRRDALIATKVGFGRVGGKPEGLSKSRVVQAVDESLSRLATDSIDLYYLHVPDSTTPIAETLDALATVQRQGKIRSFGVSNYASWQIVEIANECDRIGLSRPAVAQQLYNLLIRQLDIEYLRFAAKYALHTTVYNPLAGGLLTGRYRAGASIAKGSRFDGNKLYQGRYWSPRMIEAAEGYERIANESGVSLTSMAYAWLAQKEGVDSVLIGAGDAKQFEEALDGVAQTLSVDTLERIESEHRAWLGTETYYAR